MTFKAFLLIALVAAVSGRPAEGEHKEQNEIAADADHPWIGKWESIDGRQENFANFINALGFAHYTAEHKVWHKLWKEGDHYHHRIKVPEKNYKLDVEFKLGEEGTGSFNNTNFKYKYTEEGKDLHAEINLLTHNKVITDLYHVEGDELVKTYKVGDVQAKRWYKRKSHDQATTAASA
ncbi:secretory-abundant heat soluble protein 1-like [Paramacrobiotus metropolitanus]|uniref:secretory-abundant heat soluble protein 1-like n=1 Tax=Paramacrobiotus metropolitanus TaxID=2943436 RepID=UPI002445EB2C|nr:secretory-abundant heat soluble protein 1-like [Paramacrobiotus metropolitanus]